METVRHLMHEAGTLMRRGGVWVRSADPRRPLLLRWAVALGKNLLGLVLVLLGAIMALPGVPGQGLLTMIIGMTILDFPGKRRLEVRFLHRPRILGALNRLRARFGRQPLVLD
jgi:hypothetical protein